MLGNLLLDEQGQDMSAGGSDLLADDVIEAIIACLVQGRALQRPVDRVVIGNSDYVEVSLMLHVIQNLLRPVGPVRRFTVQMYVGFAGLGNNRLVNRIMRSRRPSRPG